MTTDTIEIRTGPKGITLKGRSPHKEAPHGPVPPPTWERRRTTTTSDHSRAQPPHRHALTRLASYRNRYRTPKKGVQWQFLHGASQVGDVPVGRMSGSQKPSKVSHPPDRTRPNTSARAPLLNKRGTPNETYTMTTPFPPSPLRAWSSTPPPEPNPPRNLYQPIPPQTRNGEGGKRQDDRHGGTIGNTTPATPTAGKLGYTRIY